MGNVDGGQPLITTIIPTYRRPQLLRRAVLSVLNQTSPNLVVWVYDNASGDETADVVRELSQMDPRVNYYCHPHNTGAFYNFVFGLGRINTPYFSVFSDDDVLLPDFYEKAMRGFIQHPEAMASITQTLVVQNDTVLDISFINYDTRLYQPPEGLLKVADGGTNSWTGTLYRREVAQEVPLDESLDGGPVEQDFLLRVAARFPYVVDKSPGAIFVVHESSLSALKSDIEVLDKYQLLLDKLKSDPQIPDVAREDVYQKTKHTLVDSLWLSGWINIKQRNFARVRQTLRSLRGDLGETHKSIVLGWAAALCERSAVFYQLYLGLNRVRKFTDLASRANRHRLQAAYGHYLEYLDKYSALE